MEFSRLTVNCPSLPSDQIETLDGSISMAEVKQALFQMKPWKAPGNDGFHAGFFT